MLPLFLLAAAPPPPLPPISEARSVIEWQLKASPRDDAQLSAEEAETIRQRYLQSIGQRLAPVQDHRPLP